MAEALYFRWPNEGLLLRGDSSGRTDDRSFVVEALVVGLRGSVCVEHVGLQEQRWKGWTGRRVEKVLWSRSAGGTRERGGGMVQTLSKTSDSRPQLPSLRVGAQVRS